ncbi:MAG TPA: helix-turn-helix transcriptional regulator [Candidatus Kryptonia bacterium]|nr:helix-turn-helix transcriptional regulator [Candidatus Kryptonia bacterium]
MRLTSVKLRRFERGLRQLEVAKRAEIAWGRLSEIENGSADPQPEELHRIAAALGISAQHLLGAASRSR